MFSLAVILVCGLLLQALANAPKCFTDAPQILIDAGPSKAKRSEVVVCIEAPKLAYTHFEHFPK